MSPRPLTPLPPGEGRGEGGASPWHHAALTLAAPAPFDAVLTPDVLLAALLRTCAHAGAQVAGHTLHRFEPHGASVVLFGPRLRLVLHTWPERGLATLDVACGHEGVTPLLEVLLPALGLHLAEGHQPQRHPGGRQQGPTPPR